MESLWFDSTRSNVFISYKNSPSSKEQNAHVTSVKNILESHASSLMSAKELSKLVAFVKGTQFDLVVRTSSVYPLPFLPSKKIEAEIASYSLQDYLQRERSGCARLENFASGLELIGQKVSLSSLWIILLSILVKPREIKLTVQISLHFVKCK